MTDPYVGLREAVYEAVERIVDDLTSRRGLAQEWSQIDRDIQKETKREWERIILESLRPLP